MSDAGAKINKDHSRNDAGQAQAASDQVGEVHPAWRKVIRFCSEMGYGEIASLKIHDGLPISAEVVTKKIRWH